MSAILELLQRRLVWEKGVGVAPYDASFWRKDACGHWMKYEDYGDTTSDFGWEIDHVIPRWVGGSTDIANLRPLHWRCNRAKGPIPPPFVFR